MVCLLYSYILIEKENNWISPAKQKRSKVSLLAGEILPEEIEYKKDRDQLDKEIFRLEVLENIIKSDKDQDQSALDSLK